jgi:diacylglycerol kinase family enzyme
MTAFVIFNPNSAGGRTGRDWKEIEEALERIFPLMSFFVTTGAGQAAHMVRDALRDGHMEIIAVGGDGTINEALNGFFERGAALSPDATFSFVHNGHDSALCRRFNIAPGWQAGIAHLARARIHKTALGRVACISAAGEPVTRYFLGSASFGLTASMARALGRARIAKLFGHGFASGLHNFLARLAWRPARVRLMAPGHDEIAGISSVSLAPHADAFAMTVRDGRGHADGARNLRIPRLTAAPTVETRGTVEVETDGESAGTLPATFELCAGAVNLRI